MSAKSEEKRRLAIICYLRAGEILEALPRIPKYMRQGMRTAAKTYENVAIALTKDLERDQH